MTEGRNIAVLVNPIGGRRNGRKYYKKVLSPMLNLTGIEYELFETDSPTYIENWVHHYDTIEFPFTDIVWVGGDGLLSQLINSIAQSPKKNELFKIPIGLIPAGSQNASCNDLGGRDAQSASINILRRNTIKGDIMKIKFKDLKKTIYGTTMLWGITSDIVKQAEKWRKVFRSARYAVCGAKSFLCSWALKTYVCKIEYRNDFEAMDQRTNHPEPSQEASSEEVKIDDNTHDKMGHSARSIKYEIENNFR